MKYSETKTEVVKYRSTWLHQRSTSDELNGCVPGQVWRTLRPSIQLAARRKRRNICKYIYIYVYILLSNHWSLDTDPSNMLHNGTTVHYTKHPRINLYTIVTNHVISLSLSLYIYIYIYIYCILCVLCTSSFDRHQIFRYWHIPDNINYKISFSKHVYINLLIFLGTNSLFVLMCHKTVNKSISFLLTCVTINITMLIVQRYESRVYVCGSRWGLGLLPVQFMFLYLTITLLSVTRWQSQTSKQRWNVGYRTIMFWLYGVCWVFLAEFYKSPARSANHFETSGRAIHWKLRPSSRCTILVYL